MTTNEPRLSVQLYSLRRVPSLADQLTLAVDSGLAFVEATSANFDELDTMRWGVETLGLGVPTGHIGMDRLRGRFAATVAAAKALGTETLIVWGFSDAERHATAEGWRRAGEELGGFATRLRDAGLRLAFHNHDWELERFTDGDLALDHLFAGAGSSPLLWQADVAWLARGGADVSSILRRHAERLATAHVKDLAPPGENADEDGWADPGDGVLPWREWWPLLEELGVRLFVLEHDEPRDPARFLRRGMAFARELM